MSDGTAQHQPDDWVGFGAEDMPNVVDFEACWACNGTGDGLDAEECPVCYGDGEMPQTVDW